MENLLVGRLVKKVYQPKLSVQWLTKPQWVILFNDAYNFMTIENQSAITYYEKNEHESHFLIFFTTELKKVEDKLPNYLLMGAICKLITPKDEDLPKEAYMGKSLTISTLINFGRLNEFIEEYDLTFDDQTMEGDILELSRNKEFTDLSAFLQLARSNSFQSGYMGHYENYFLFLQGLKITFKKEGFL